MTSTPREPTPPDTDGWLEGEEPAAVVVPSMRALIRRPDGRISPGERAARSSAMAILCHLSVFFGFPIFLFPMVMRDDAFVLHHAKASALAFVLFYGLLLAGFVWHAGFFWVMLAAYIFPLVGIWRASRGERAGVLGLGHQGEGVFFLLQASPRDAKLLEE